MRDNRQQFAHLAVKAGRRVKRAGHRAAAQLVELTGQGGKFSPFPDSDNDGATVARRAQRLEFGKTDLHFAPRC